MRYLSSISLALIVLMALACTATPAEPTPNIDATVEARLAQEREIEATVEARLAEEKPAKPTPIPTVKRPPTKVPTPTQNYFAQAQLLNRWQSALAYYANTPEGVEHQDCLYYATHNSIGSPNETQVYYHNSPSRASFTPNQDDYWTVEVTGEKCKGIESGK